MRGKRVEKLLVNHSAKIKLPLLNKPPLFITYYYYCFKIRLLLFVGGAGASSNKGVSLCLVFLFLSFHFLLSLISNNYLKLLLSPRFSLYHGIDYWYFFVDRNIPCIIYDFFDLFSVTLLELSD